MSVNIEKIKMNKECPICGNKLKTYRDYMGHIVLEEWSDCTVCNMYHFGFATGNYQVTIGILDSEKETIVKHWEWSYNQDETEIQKEINEAINKAYIKWNNQEK